MQLAQLPQTTEGHLFVATRVNVQKILVLKGTFMGKSNGLAWSDCEMYGRKAMQAKCQLGVFQVLEPDRGVWIAVLRQQLNGETGIGTCLSLEDGVRKCNDHFELHTTAASADLKAAEYATKLKGFDSKPGS